MAAKMPRKTDRSAAGAPAGKREPSFKDGSRRVDCYHGDRCTLGSCKKSHPSGCLCPSFPDACENPGRCASRHPSTVDREKRSDCKHGDECTIKQCAFKHPNGPLCPSYPNCSASGAGKGPVCARRHPSNSNSSPSQESVRGANPTRPVAVKGCSDAQTRLDQRIAHTIKRHKMAIAIEETRLQELQTAMRSHVDIDLVGEESKKAVQARITEMHKQLDVFHNVIRRIAARRDLEDNQKQHLAKREIFRFRNRLPAFGKRLEIESCLQTSKFTIVQGQTGSGKSTQIPQYAADLACFTGKRVLCTQPRKLAATSLATRVAFEYSGGYDKVKVGHAVGFRVGGRYNCSPNARIEFVTEAILLDMIVKARTTGTGPKNPFANVGCVIIDEAHERSITCDLIMGSFKESHPSLQDVKVVVMSATIDLAMFSAFYNNAPVIEIEGRMFPVDVNYVASGRDGLLDANRVVVAVAECAMTIHQRYPDPTDGDILCFLPGQDDVLRAKQHFETGIAKRAGQGGASVIQSRVAAHALYGKQDPQEQELVFQKHVGPAAERKRKVIFSTDIAETSVTIDGVVFVVDCGLKKDMVYDPVRNMSSLKVHAISRSSAIQRMGRAGRTQPGKCFRLYSTKDYNEMEIGSVAEIFRQPLSLAMLTLYHLGINPRQFAWIQSPSDDAMALAEEELMYLGSIDASKRLTTLGTLIAEVQIDPKIVRMIDRGARQGLGAVVTDLAAIMSVADIFFWRGGSDKKSKAEAAIKKARLMIEADGDIVSMYRVFCVWKMILETGVVQEDGTRRQQPLPSGSTNNGNANILDEDEEEDDAEEAMPSSYIAALAATVKQCTQGNPNFDMWKKQADEDDDAASDICGSELSFDADDDTSSECLEEGSPPKQKSSSKVQNKFQRERLAKKWCMEQSLNGKALGMAYTYSKELRTIFRTTPGWKSAKNDGAESTTVDGESIRRLITAGYFMNAARMKPQGRGNPQYYALYSGVLGSLFFGTALNPGTNDRGITRDAKANGIAELPQWILFDSILRLTSAMYLSLGTPIKEEWIQEESTLFHELCTEKSRDLPVEVLEWENMSFQILRSVFGKGFSKLNELEVALKCNLSVNSDLGKVTACCAPGMRDKLRATLERIITTERAKLEKDIVEEVYMGNTRAVLGKGFEVSELLFANEFSTLFVRNLGQKTDDEMYQFVEQLRNKSAGGNNRRHQAPAVRTIDVASHVGGKSSATIRFMSKEIAKEVYDNLRGEFNSEAEVLDVSPGRFGLSSQKNGLKQDFAGRIKLTWADGASKQKGKVFFPSAADANNFITNCCNVRTLEALSPAAVGVDLSRRTQGTNGMAAIGRKAPAALPTVKRVPHPSQPGKFVFIFDEDNVVALEAADRVNIHFGVSISGLPSSIDEVELLGLIRPIPVLYAKISRQSEKNETAATSEQGVLEGRSLRMLPLLSFLNNSAIHSDFYDQASCRAGVVVYFDDLRQLETTFLNASGSDLWDPADRPNGQPVRMELEYTYTTSMHSELHRCYKDRVAEVVAFARSKGIISEEIPSKHANASSKAMVTLKFRGASLTLLTRVREQLEACLECEKVVGDNVRLLFSYTGRMLAQQFQSASLTTAAQQTYIRWIHKTREFWVYGEPEPRRQAIDKLSKLSADLGALDVLDKLVRLDRLKVAALGNNLAKPRSKKIDFSDTQKALAKIIRDCDQRPYYYHINDNARILLSGTNAAVNAVINAFRSKGLLFKERERAAGTKPICGACSDVVDDLYLILSLCNHACCVVCFEHQLRSDGLPLKCPTCKQSIHVNDIIRNADNEIVSSLVENAVFEYVAAHKDTCMICPRPGCNQILPTYTGILEGKNGGNFIFCDNCLQYYCIDCSNKSGRHVLRHDDESCEDVQSGGLSKVAQHVRHIQDKILNLWCPRCETPFLDFSGCTSVECGNPSCKCYFCANCLVYNSFSSSETHEHVRQCDKNPSQATNGVKSYFVCDQALSEVHRAMRIKNLVTYFTSEIKNELLRFNVHIRIAKDLHDLGIKLPVELRGKANGTAHLQPHLTYIRDELLNLRCPACHLVFIDFDFDSCAALTCANTACNRGFCAYCLADCQEDAHAHVSKCELNPNRPYFYVTKEIFTDIHKRRRESAIVDYFHAITQQDAETARSVWKEIQEDLKYLELEVPSP